jgi:hypothetical protein
MMTQMSEFMMVIFDALGIACSRFGRMNRGRDREIKMAILHLTAPGTRGRPIHRDLPSPEDLIR